MVDIEKITPQLLNEAPPLTGDHLWSNGNGHMILKATMDHVQKNPVFIINYWKSIVITGILIQLIDLYKLVWLLLSISPILIALFLVK